MPHSVLSVTLAFGLVNVPVRLYTAAASHKVTFRLLDRKTGQPVRQQLVSAPPTLRQTDEATASESETIPLRAAHSMPAAPIADGADRDEATGSPSDSLVPREDIIKGYEIGGDQYIAVTAEELKALEAEANQHAEIQQFVSLAQIDPVYFEKTYYLGPDKGGEKVYRLLAHALQNLHRGAIAKLVMRGKEKLVLVRPTDQDRLVLDMLYYAEEVRDASEIYVPDVTLSDAEIQLAQQVIDSLSVDLWDPKNFHDTYRERVMALIEQKRQGKYIKRHGMPTPSKVVDLMGALRASLALAAKRPSRRRDPPRRNRSIRKIKRAG